MDPEGRRAFVLAHAHVRALLGELCQDAREAAARVAGQGSDGSPDAEAIHDHRVALRRLRTALAASASLFEEGPFEQARDGLRRLAREAGAVRDEEVLAETLAGFDLPAETRRRVDAWLAHRARRERALRAAVARELAPGASVPGAAVGASAFAELLSSIEALPLRRKAAAVSTRAIARAALREAARKVRAQAARPDAASPAARHRLRIRWKRVRYTAELFAGVLAGEGQAREALAGLIKTAARMQKRLGEMHDLDEAIARIARARRLSPGDRMVVHHRLRTARAALSDRLAKELPSALSALPEGEHR
jgi:CHAD domain-containing protein